MNRNRFFLLCCLLVLCVLFGGVYKHTALAENRVQLTYQYKMQYKLLVTDVGNLASEMYYPGVGLYFDKETVAGIVTEVSKAPAASGKWGCCDLTLTVSASGSRVDAQGYGSYPVTEQKRYQFLSRFVAFEGTITEVNEE